MNNSDVVSVDKDALAVELNKVKFETNTESSTYANEKETYNYIASISKQEIR